MSGYLCVKAGLNDQRYKWYNKKQKDIFYYSVNIKFGNQIKQNKTKKTLRTSKQTSGLKVS